MIFLSRYASSTTTYRAHICQMSATSYIQYMCAIVVRIPTKKTFFVNVQNSHTKMKILEPRGKTFKLNGNIRPDEYDIKMAPIRTVHYRQAFVRTAIDELGDKF